MPLFKDFSDAHSTILLWKFDDADEFIVDELVESEDQEKIKNYLPKKLSEYLMIRKMLKTIVPGHKILYKAIGQPYLYPKDAYISITHSFPLAAVAVSQKRVGIDVERVTDKIVRIKEKFLHKNEHLWIPEDQKSEYLTIIWVIKEALYKLHPSKYWSLKMHYEVQKFDIDDLSKVQCSVFDDDFIDEYVSKVIFIDGVYFAIIEEDHQLNYRIPLKNKMF